MADDDKQDDVTLSKVCMRCGGALALSHEGDCPHCGQSASMMGFEFDDDPEAAEAELLNEVEFIRNTPPNCINDFTTKRTEISHDPYDATVQWEIGCKCGNRTGSVFGYHEEDNDFFWSPLSFKCDSCNNEHIFFDQGLHGYNRAFDSEDTLEEPIDPDGEKIAAGCPKCASQSLIVRLTFSNPGGSGVDLEDEPEYTDRCQDFFDNFKCQCICSQCRKSWTLTEFECA
jgi:hypothetical protein